MIVNVIHFAFREELDEATKKQVLEGITQTSKMDCVSFSTVGKDLGNPEDGYSHAYCAALEDTEVLKCYFANPIHRKGDFLFLPAISKLYRLARTDDSNPNLLQEVNAIWGIAMEEDPEWKSLFGLIPEVHI